MDKVAIALVFFCGTLAMVSGTSGGHGEDDQWLNKLTNSQEKVTKFRFFIQDIAIGPNSTVVTVAQGPDSKKTPTGFGTLNIIDDCLTEGPELTSNQIGRAQGFASFIAKDRIAFLLAFNFVFTTGEFNGSTLTVLGRNAPYLAVREMPIIGGTGVFRLARGFVRTNTYHYDPTTTNGVYEYNVVAIHY